MMNRELQIAIQLFVDQHTKKTGSAPTMGEINEFIEIHINGEDAVPRVKFDGLSSEQIYNMHRFLWMGDASPIEINELSDDDFAQMPLFRQMERIVSILQEKSSIKLTVKGNLPMNIVQELYSIGLPDEYVDTHPNKRLTEDYAYSVQLACIILDVMRVIKVQKGSMTLTARGKKLVKSRQDFFSETIHNFCLRLNWAYFDRYEVSENIGRYGVGFSFAMVKKYGNEWHDSEFYSAKYFEAFPTLSPTEWEYDDGVPGGNCYYIRTFERFMLEFGFVEIKNERVKCQLRPYEYYNIIKHIKKSNLFDKVFTFKF